MDKATFSNRLDEVTGINRDFATRFVSNHLPDSNRYLVRLNQSCDETLRPGEHVFPRDTDPVAPLTEAETVDLLSRHADWMLGQCILRRRCSADSTRSVSHGRSCRS